jgi:hypothetical protein
MQQACLNSYGRILMKKMARVLILIPPGFEANAIVATLSINIDNDEISIVNLEAVDDLGVKAELNILEEG